MIKTISNLNQFTNSSKCAKVEGTEAKAECSRKKLDERWIANSQDLSLWEGFNRHIEFNQTYHASEETCVRKGYGNSTNPTCIAFKKNSSLDYVGAGSFYDHGGYVKNINVQIAEKAKALEQVSDLRKYEFLNHRTKLLVTDFTLYNSYSDIFTVVIIPT